jgi:type II secretory pathway component GspD/PulD (secretin)
MKTIPSLIFGTIMAAAFSSAFAADTPPKEAEQTQKALSETERRSPEIRAAAEPKADNATPPRANNADITGDTNANGNAELRMNFQDASLETVLKYLSDAAGFIINIKPGTSIRGKVNILSSQPVTKDEAVDLLDTALLQNGLAAIRNARVITIVNRDEAKTQHIPVFQGSDPDKIPLTDRIVTQIIPVRFVEVGQLVKDLQPLVSMQTTMTANEAGNSVVITDTQANIHRVAEVIKAIDSGAEDFTELRVFPLAHSDPSEMADLLTSLFPDDTSRNGGGNSQSPFGGRFGRFFGGGGGPFGQGNQANSGSNSQNQRIKKRNRVIAVADQRTTSVVVSASRDLIDQIEDIVTRIDGDPKGQAMVTVLKTPYADPDDIKQVLQDLFNKNNKQQNRNNQNQTGALQQRSTSQNQQNNSTSRNTMTPNSGRGGNTPSFQ